MVKIIFGKEHQWVLKLLVERKTSLGSTPGHSGVEGNKLAKVGALNQLGLQLY